jgi:RNA polymerase sigma factor (TIGR02999 family)
MITIDREPDGSDDSITSLLAELSKGHREAEARLVPQVYAELRRLAGHYMRRERANHTLQATALVHEAYAHLVQQKNAPPWRDRAHFFATAAQVMRHILVDHARAHQAEKRGGVQQQVTLNDALLSSKDRVIDVLALHEVLERLTTLNARQGKIVEMHFFSGLGFEEIAMVLDLSERTVKREWSMARAWLRNELGPAGREDRGTSP